ncbi:MAG: hypothetical protein HY744_14395 [Deltaproteobacteria bacterium]|nr:hypothetical protein [Deltaproteobacteria bacterium]
MVLRLLVGLIKGLVIGALLGGALAWLGFALPGVLVAYASAAVAGALVACLAGKPIWAKDARIEVGAKVVAGLLLGPALMFAARRWLTTELPLSDVPFALPAWLAGGAAKAQLGALAVTSVAMVAAVLAGFFEADNQSTPKPKLEAARPGGGKRVAASVEAQAQDEAELEAGDEGPRARRKK